MLDDPTFKAMISEVEASQELYRPSKFWEYLNSINTQWLTELSLDNFKRTVSQNYFNWLIVSPRDPQFRAALREWSRHPTLRPLLARLESPELLRTTIGLERTFGPLQQFVYRVFVAMHWEIAVRRDTMELTKALTEPSLGNPIGVWIGDRRISQDLANSVRECNQITASCIPRGTTRPVIAELGAGYGRLAFAFLTHMKAKYVIVDIPPALYVSQWYLSRLFPDRRIFSFRNIDSFKNIEAEFDDCDVAFLTPNQLPLLPSESFDVFVSISTFPEMSLAQIGNYLSQISRLTRKGVYLKQWRHWFNDKDNFEFRYTRLVLPGEWVLQHDEPDIVQPLFQERAWTRIAVGSNLIERHDVALP